MKRNLFLTAGLLAFGLAVMATVYAQQQAMPDSSAKVDQAAVLLAQGKAQEARTLLANIGEADASYARARSFDALCLYAQKDAKKFLKAVQSPEVQSAQLPPALREELDFDQLDALFTLGRYDEFAPKAMDFQEDHPDSRQGNNVMERLSAALFTQGMREVYRACALKDEGEFKNSWTKGRTNLTQFLAVASAWGKTNYQVLPDRQLKSEIWTARIALGDETNVLREIAAQNPGDLEAVSFLNVKLQQRLQPQAVDENLQRMGAFLKRFPKSSQVKRVRFDMANISFNRGEASLLDAKAAAKAGDTNTAATKLKQAQSYFNYTASLRDKLFVDPIAGIEESDVVDRQDDLLNSYCLLGNFQQVLAEATALADRSQPGELQWMLGKGYRGIGLVMLNPADTNAVTDFEAVLAQGINGRPAHDLHVIGAAKWRMYVARLNHDEAKVAQIYRWVMDSKANKNQKSVFAKYCEDRWYVAKGGNK